MTHEVPPISEPPEDCNPSLCNISVEGSSGYDPLLDGKYWVGVFSVGDTVYVGDETRESFVAQTPDGHKSDSLPAPADLPELPFCCVPWAIVETAQPDNQKSSLFRWVQPKDLRRRSKSDET